MAFLTFCSTNLFNGHAIELAILHVFVELLVNAVESIFSELHLGLAVAVDAPTHAQVGKLLHFTHLLDFTMAGLAGHLAGYYVLGVVEINMVRQVMDLDPLNGLGL